MNTSEIPIVIIGGGIIGLSIGHELVSAGLSDSFCILDSSPHLGDHTSGRNSGVLHAGLYYPENSLKKKFCLEGLELWKSLCKKNDLFYKNCGKYVFAEKENEDLFEKLFDNASSNGADVKLSSKAEINTLKEFCHLDFAFYSKNTSIVDPSELISFFKKRLEMADIPILLNHKVDRIDKKSDCFEIEVCNYKIKCEYIINAAGHGAVHLREFLGLNDMSQFFVKGHYLKANKKFYNEALLYPMPEKNLKGLGIHTCIDADGSVKFGPDASDVNEFNYLMQDENIKSMKTSLLKNFKIDPQHLTPDFCGIRPRIIRNSEVVSDFLIESPIKNYIELLGIESPGLTSALSIAKYVRSIM